MRVIILKRPVGFTRILALATLLSLGQWWGPWLGPPCAPATQSPDRSTCCCASAGHPAAAEHGAPCACVIGVSPAATSSAVSIVAPEVKAQVADAPGHRTAIAAPPEAFRLACGSTSHAPMTRPSGSDNPRGPPAHA